MNKIKYCKIFLLGGECVKCYKNYYLTHNNVCKICPPSFLEHVKKDYCNSTIYSLYCEQFIVQDFPYVKFNSSSTGNIDCTPSIMIFTIPLALLLIFLCCLIKGQRNLRR